ncbi:hypothetical protein CDD80_5129 [Ophiocordyceps camponoti-rufipedis]|uniref:Uncharacterized protein n=1 Tax=Ophiocordyceps camponoti-rufipedis TaxID=2004952 RepID=A0A2C5YW62_9HYPO|nr:hypothetical protein CDD80_5129 [Ophiocordyceps camponoti-rufipedis]
MSRKMKIYESPWDLLPKSEAECMTGEELRWYTRTRMEASHRLLFKYQHLRPQYEPSVKDIHRLPEIDEFHFSNTCNKSVPIFITPSHKSTCCHQMLSIVLHNYVYRRWFIPYKTEISWHRFIYRSVWPKDLTPEATLSQSTVDTIISFNKAHCASIEKCQHDYNLRLAQGDSFLASEIRVPRTDFPTRRPALTDCREVCVLQPLYRALILIIFDGDYNDEDSKTVGKIPIYLVRTGIEDGLSEPISFASIADKIEGWTTNDSAGEPGIPVKTTLETAIDFVIHLEAREVAAFGFHPDTAWRPDHSIAKLYSKLTGGATLVGSTTTFVNTDKFTEWVGDGERNDSWMMTLLEDHLTRRYHYRATSALRAPPLSQRV